MDAVTYPNDRVIRFITENMIPLRVAFLAPEELIPSLLLGIGKSYFETDQFDKALGTLEKLLGEYPESGSAPEAIYLRGVCRYKSTQNPEPLKAAYEQLTAEYPSSEWTKRAYPYRLL
jgi:outer membrane protein assembly factor BamD (BamD/ComL family)